MSKHDSRSPGRAADLPPGWGPVTGEAAASLEAQLAREAGPGHALGAISAQALAQRFDGDDVLFALDDGRIAHVLLTWSESRASDPSSPATAIFESFDAWLVGEQSHVGADEAVSEFSDALDLHAFAPRDAEALVRDFIDHWAARDSGPHELRIIHGKGIGAMRELVHAVLAKHPAVERFGLATDRSSWGATIVIVRGPT